LSKLWRFALKTEAISASLDVRSSSDSESDATATDGTPIVDVEVAGTAVVSVALDVFEMQRLALLCDEMKHGRYRSLFHDFFFYYQGTGFVPFEKVSFSETLDIQIFPFCKYSTVKIRGCVFRLLTLNDSLNENLCFPVTDNPFEP
jgi:hypothetical protein